MLMDIYVLAPERSAAQVERFLTHFLCDNQRAEAEYWVRLGSVEPVAIFDSSDELFRFCETQPNAEARAYWINRAETDPHSVHVFFLPSGGLVLGLSVATPDPTDWNRWLNELLKFAGAKFGYYTGECPPADTIDEFIRVASEARQY